MGDLKNAAEKLVSLLDEIIKGNDAQKEKLSSLMSGLKPLAEKAEMIDSEDKKLKEELARMKAEMENLKKQPQ